MAVFDGVIPAIIGAANAAAGGYEIDRSLRFNSADSAYLSRTPSTVGNRKTWTWSGWVKRGAFGASTNLFSHVSNANSQYPLFFNSSDNLDFYVYVGSFTARKVTSAVFRDPSAWYHVVAVWDTSNATAEDRMRLYVNGTRLTTFSSSVNPSLNLDSQINNTVEHGIGTNAPLKTGYANFYLADVHFIDGQALAASYFGEYDDNNNWNPKEYSGTYGTNGFYLKFADNSSNAALGTDSSGNNNDWTVNNIIGPIANGGTTNVSTVASSGWVAGGATVNMVDGNTGTIYNALNGGVSFSSAVTGYFKIQHGRGAAGDCWNIFYDSSNNVIFTSPTRAYTAGETFTMGPYYVSGVSKIISASDATGAGSDGHGTGAFYINDAIINTNSDSATSFTYPTSSNTDSFIDSPTNYTASSGNNGGNYATVNALLKNSTTTLANGNLDVTSSGQTYAVSSIVPSSGKWYFEITLGSIVTNSFIGLYGTAPLGGSYAIYGINGFGFTSTGWGSPSSTVTGSGVTGDVIGLAFDADAKTLEFYKNGSSIGTISGWTYVENWSIGFSANSTISTPWVFNFGQRPFAYTPPTGYLSLCTQNLTDPTIADGSTAMDILTYTGDGSTSERTVTGLNLASDPDLIWVKNRSSATGTHLLWDTVRSGSLNLSSAANYKEYPLSGWGYGAITGNAADGIKVQKGSLANAYHVNENNDAYVAWTWDAGTSTVSNTDGSITSSVRVNASAGFSIVSYTGSGTSPSTIGHGLNAVPEMILVKNRSDAWNWAVYHKGLIDGSTVRYLILNSTSAQVTGSGHWQNTVPSSSVFTVGNDDQVNAAVGTDTYIAYCFAPVEGYSAFGSYTGNGNADGPFVYTGFRPKWIMVKRHDGLAPWVIVDTERNTFNVMDNHLLANDSAAENGSTIGNVCDSVSNGFKFRGSDGWFNGSSASYIYAAFAEHPFKTARAR